MKQVWETVQCKHRIGFRACCAVLCCAVLCCASTYVPPALLFPIHSFNRFPLIAFMRQAYKMADGRKIEDKRCLVDVERGRTVPNWCAAGDLPAAHDLLKWL